LHFDPLPHPHRPEVPTKMRSGPLRGMGQMTCVMPDPAKELAHRATEKQRNRENASTLFLCSSV
jgi:hypothetical protein